MSPQLTDFYTRQKYNSHAVFNKGILPEWGPDGCVLVCFGSRCIDFQYETPVIDRFSAQVAVIHEYSPEFIHAVFLLNLFNKIKPAKINGAFNFDFRCNFVPVPEQLLPH